jgi:sec-independent protein translocase protein TatC
VNSSEEDEFKRGTVLEHLGELISNVKVAVYYLVAGMAVGYVIAPRVVDLLSIPLFSVLPNFAPSSSGGTGTGLVIIDPFEKVWVQLRISGVIGVFLSLPLITWQVGKFVGPGLYRSERRKIQSFLAASYIIFLVGIVVGYYVSLPVILKALLHFGGMDQMALLSLSRYMNAAIGVLLATGLLMEIPIAIFFLSLWGWVPVEKWSSGRKVAIIANAIISAFLSPPDVMSMIFMMIPVQLLYECGILAARMAEWKRRGKQNQITH